MSTNPGWQLAFVLPNLRLGSRDRSPAELTLGLKGIAIVPASDRRVVEITEWSEAAKRFLSSFHDGNGRPIAPAALVVRRDWLGDMNRDAESVIAFRNAVAVAAILRNRACWRSYGWSGISWSETFDYHPAQLRRDGSKFDSCTPAVNQTGFQLDGLSLTPDLRLPREDRLLVDESLADHLGCVWHLRYRRGRDKRNAARVFRSLEAAYDALSIGFKSYASLTEVGLDAVHWTTAIEGTCLAAEGRGEQMALLLPDCRVERLLPEGASDQEVLGEAQEETEVDDSCTSDLPSPLPCAKQVRPW